MAVSRLDSGRKMERLFLDDGDCFMHEKSGVLYSGMREHGGYDSLKMLL